MDAELMNFLSIYETIVTVLFIIMGIALVIFMLVSYIFTGLSLYKIGKRRGLKAYGLAWVPFGQEWMLGSAADQYNRKMNGKNSHFRASMLILSILSVAVSAITLIIAIDGLYELFDVLKTDPMMDTHLEWFFTWYAKIMIAELVLFAAAIPFSIVYYVVMYKIYRSAMPKNAGWMLALSILFGNLAAMICLFCIRNKDEGFLEEDPEEIKAEQERLALYN